MLKYYQISNMVFVSTFSYRDEGINYENFEVFHINMDRVEVHICDNTNEDINICLLKRYRKYHFKDKSRQFNEVTYPLSFACR